MDNKTEKIRKLINDARTQQILLENKENWLQTCSSLDVIEDTQLAIDSFFKLNKKIEKNDGEKYLFSYGLLQALFLQQDAVSNLCEGLGIPFSLKDYPSLQNVREIRNDSIGHPTKRDRSKEKKKSYHFISRFSMNSTGFELLSYIGERPIFRNVNFKELIDSQKSLIDLILNKVIEIGKKREAEHKEQFRMDKLSSIFRNTSDYYFQKVFEVIHNPSNFEYHIDHYSMIKEMVADFESKLLERGIKRNTFDGVNHALEYTDYIFAKLDHFFSEIKSGGKGSLDQKAAYIFLSFLKDTFNDLKQCATEIDEDYNSND